MVRGMALSRHKTTVYLDRHTLSLIERAALEQRRSSAALIREALAVYAERLQPERLRSQGCVRAARRDLASKDEQLLREAFRRKK
jgi:hypothetical protein